MKNREIARQIQKINDLISKTSLACGGDIELQAHWAKYLCVLSAGFVENALSEIYGAYVDKAASPAVAKYARANLSKIQNPKSTKFIEIARSFKPDWGEDLEAFVGDDGRREAIVSLLSNRHLIAHGQDSSITISKVKDWLLKTVEVIEHIEDLCI